MALKCIDFYELIDSFFNMTSKIYECLLKVLYLLDSDIRRDIFIGVTGLTIAIIVFIAEAISNKEYELEKRVILYKTKIINNMKFCIMTLLIMFISSIVISSHEDITTKSTYIQNDYLYMFLQIMINILIIIFMYRTFKMFKVAVKLNTDKEYFNKELDNYVNKRSSEIEKEAANNSLENIKKLKQNFDDYVKNNKILSTDIYEVGFSEKSYMPIYTNKRGIIKNFNYKKIDSMIESINDVSIEESKDYLPNNEPVFVFAKQIGDKLEKESIIGYCLKGYKVYFQDFSNSIIYDEHSMYIADEIKLINKNLLDFASDFSEPDDFDETNKLFNYFNYLYQNNLNGVRKFALYQLEETARNLYKDKYKNHRYVIFLNRISSLAYKDENFEEYQQISRLIFFLYYQQLKIYGNDTKKVAYNFANHYFKYDYFSIKKNKDLRFYDELMSNLLRFICSLIQDKEFDVLSILFKNILLEHDRHISDEFDEKDILNLQFAIGIVQCLIMLVDKNDISEEEKKEITGIINWARQYFINTYDAWQIVNNFKKYCNKKTSIQDVYDHLEFDFVDHEYLSSWSGWHIDEKLILKELLYSFKIRTVFKDSINYDEITKDDKYYFSSLLELISSNEKTTYEKKLNINCSFDSLIESLKAVIKDSEKKEEEFIKNNQLDKNKLDEFEKIIKETAFKSSELDDYLSGLNKIIKNDIKIKRVCGINQLIPRDVFFENYGGHETLAEQFGGVFDSAKEREFINKIDSISCISEDNVNNVLMKIEKIEDYLLITNYLNCDNINGYDGYSDCIKIGDKELQIMKIPQIESIYLIEKKYLPRLQYCSFDEEYDKKNIVGSLYYELSDCSRDDDLRAEIIEKSNWLSEKGTIEEQNEYLKQQCRLKLFMAFKFIKIKKSRAIKFIINNE